MNQALPQLSPITAAEIELDDDAVNHDPVAANRQQTVNEASRGRLSNQLTWFLFVILVLNTGVALTITGFHLQQEYVSLTQSRVFALGENVEILLEDVLGLGLPLGSLEGVDKELEKVVTGDTSAVYANITNLDGNVLYSYPNIAAGTPFHPDLTRPLMKSGTRETFATASSYNMLIPIHEPNNMQVVGSINIGVLKKTVITQTVKTLINVVVTFIGFIVITIILLRLITKRSIKPLEQLTRSALALADGDLKTRVSVDVSNEIGSLAESFNYMATQLEEDRSTLTLRAAQLEQKNEKLYAAHREIMEREKTLKDAQSQLVLSEKMASLGLLIAGIAHEINTPAGAISNVASELGEKVRTVIESLDKVNELPERDVVSLVSFINMFMVDGCVTTAGASWKQGREVRKWLMEHDVPKAKEATDTLSKYGLLNRELINDRLDILRLPWTVRLADALATIHVGMSICGSSISKISQIVKALKYYAYTDMDKTSDIDLNENVDNALLLLHNKLKYDAEVKKRLSPLPPVKCTSEISQVWTNLISNAHDAISESHDEDAKGVIQIETEHRGDWVCVAITDDGPGIPADKQEKIFDPFFTTKGIGKGTGLGLSIVSGIVQKHRGKIGVESMPGKTTFTVLLPVCDPPK